MRKLKINLIDLTDAFDNSRIGFEYYLDVKTGEIFYTSDEAMDTDEIEEIYERIECETDRYLNIPIDSSRDGYRDMETFSNTVEDENLKEKLCIALNGRGAFRRFKDVLFGYPDKREEWFKFKDERLKHRVFEWLEINEIEIEEGKNVKL